MGGMRVGMAEAMGVASSNVASCAQQAPKAAGVSTAMDPDPRERVSRVGVSVAMTGGRPRAAKQEDGVIGKPGDVHPLAHERAAPPQAGPDDACGPSTGGHAIEVAGKDAMGRENRVPANSTRT